MVPPAKTGGVDLRRGEGVEDALHDLHPAADVQADQVDVLVEGHAGDRVRVDHAGEDHLKARVTQGAGDDVDSAPVPVEARLRHQDTRDVTALAVGGQKLTGNFHDPNTSL